MAIAVCFIPHCKHRFLFEEKRDDESGGWQKIRRFILIRNEYH